MNDGFQNINLRSINAKILNVERIYGKDSKITQRIYETINRAYGTSEKTRFTSIPKTTSFSTSIKILHAYEQVLNSPFTSAAGRKNMAKRWKESFNSSRGWSDARIARAQDIFTNSVNWNRFRELAGDFGSDRAIAILTQDDEKRNIDAQQLDEYFDAYTETSRNVDSAQVTDDLINFVLSNEDERIKIIAKLLSL